MSDVQDQFDLDVPQSFADALHGAYAHHLNVPQGIDQTVLTAARDKFERRRKLKLMVRWGAGISSAAAAIVVVLLLLPHRASNPTNQLANTTPTKSIRGDIDASGQLDIVDAMALARHLRAGDPSESTWDVNGDAAVDQRDVDALAAAAVSLKQQGIAARRLPSINELGLDRLPGATRVQVDFAVLHVKPEDRQ